MPAIEFSDLDKLHDNFREFHTFIETGTLAGETIFRMEPLFDKLYTIEIKPEYLDDAKARYSGEKIRFVLGDSSKVFKELLPEINEPAIFFLDGHWSAGESGKGEKDCPLIEELTIINEKFQNSAIIIIDDRRLFGKGPNKNNEVCNWEDISDINILMSIKSRVKEVYCIPSCLHPEDRLVIHINPISS